MGCPGADATVGEIAKEFIAFIKRQIGYLIHYHSNIENLKQQLQKLEDDNNGVTLHVDAEKRKFKEKSPKVLHWQEKVDPMIQKVRRFLDEEIKGNNNKCLKGMCPDVKSRYSLSRKATKMATEVGTLGQEALNLGPICHPRPPQVIEFINNTKGIQDFGSRRSIMKDVLEALNNDDVCMISVCGMGGVGKTTMVQKLVETIKGGNLYGNVVMTTISQSPNLENIQSAIIEQLGLEVKEKTFEGRAKKLSDWFMEYDKKILLILDDVWDRELNFEAIGIPLASEKFKRHKILLTSRNTDVCISLGSQRDLSQRKFEIKVLEDEEAWDLFRSVVGNSVDRDLQDTAEKIVAECGALPISIVTIAGALKNKPKHFWDDALRKLKKSDIERVYGMDKVYSAILLSYSSLKNQEAKSCLLLCALFPEDFNVPVESLIRCGMGLQLFKDVADFHQARDRVFTLIDELKYSFLLLDGDDDSKKSVKMHDVIRDVAISIAKRDEHYLVSCDAVVQKWPDADRCKDSTAISIFCKEIKEFSADIECPMLQFLSIDYQSSAEDLKYNVFSRMKQLKVLILGIPSLPKSLDFPKFLRTLRLNFELGWLPEEIGDLIYLEILEIETEHLKELPKEIALLKNLKLLDLKKIRKLDHIPSGVLSKLSKLEELYVTWQFGEWESKGDGEETNASLKEIDCLPLTALQVRVPNLLIGLPKSIFRNLRRFNVMISESNDDTVGQYLGNRLCIKGGSVAEIKASEICCLLRTTELWKLENVVDIKNICELNDDGFPKLESLELRSLKNLKEVWHSSFPKTEIAPEIQLPSFNSLQSIDISLCEKLKYVFPLYVARGMRQLQEIKIGSCENMEGIFYKEEMDDEKITANEVEFPNLKLLVLYNLPKLKGFLVDMKVMADSMEQPNASNGGAQLISTLFPSSSNWLRLSNLQELKLIKCSLLKVAFAPFVAQQLVQLQTLKIYECEKMEYIVGVADGRQEEEDKTVFPMLNKLKLQDLPELVAFCADGHVSLNRHSLKELRVEECPKLRTFGSVRRGREEESNEAQNNHVFSRKEVSLVKNEDSTIGHADDYSAFLSNLMECFLNLETLDIRDCDAYKVFKIPSDTMGFQNLQDLKVYRCDSLMHIFPPHLPKLLVKLQTVWITDCEKMEAIVGKDDEAAPESASDKIEFPQLRVLSLDRLPNLKSFCAISSAVELQSLEYLTIFRCNQMRIFSYGPSNTPKLEEIERNRRRYALEGDINGSMKKEAIPDSMEQPNASNGSPQVISTLFPSPNWLRLSNLQELFLVNCDTLKVAFAPSVAQQLVQLKSLYIESCEKMEYVVGVADGRQEEETVFPMLNSISLQNLSELVAFCADGRVSLNCHSLKEVTVDNCRKLRSFGGSSGLLITGRDQQSIEPQNQHLLSTKQVSLIKNGDSSVGHLNDHFALIPCDLMKRLRSLGRLIIYNCNTLKVIFSFQEHHVAVGAVNSFVSLSLYGLTDLTHIWFKIPPGTVGFQNLQYLEVRKCDSLTHIFPPHLPKLLVKLRHMWIYSCEKVEVIVGKYDKEETESASDKIEFPRLRSLRFKELPNLKSFCAGSSAVELQSLESLEIEGCNQMRSFSYGPSNTPKLEEIVINERRYALEGDINGTMKKEIETARAFAEEEMSPFSLSDEEGEGDKE